MAADDIRSLHLPDAQQLQPGNRTPISSLGPSSRGPSVDEQRHIRVAWQYYVDGYTQEEIACRLGVTRARINRMLAVCRERGIIQIRINSRLAPCLQLEQSLERLYGIEARVTMTPEDSALVRDVVANESAHYLTDHLPGVKSLGIGWGETLRLAADAMIVQETETASVVSLQGGVTRGAGANMFEIAARFAEHLRAEPFFLAAPLYASTKEARDALLDQTTLAAVYEAAANVDMAVISVGDLTNRSMVVSLKLIANEIDALKQAGAVGDILGCFLDAEGALVEHPINQRVVSLSLDDLARVKKVILAAGGLHKVDIIRAVLRRGCITSLVTDQETAEALVKGESEPRGRAIAGPM